MKSLSKYWQEPDQRGLLARLMLAGAMLALLVLQLIAPAGCCAQAGDTAVPAGLISLARSV